MMTTMTMTDLRHQNRVIEEAAEDLPTNLAAEVFPMPRTRTTTRKGGRNVMTHHLHLPVRIGSLGEHQIRLRLLKTTIPEGGDL